MPVAYQCEYCGWMAESGYHHDCAATVRAERDEARRAARHLLKYTTLDESDKVYHLWHDQWPWLRESQ